MTKYQFWFKGCSPKGMKISGRGDVEVINFKDAFELAEQVIRKQFPNIILFQNGGLKIKEKEKEKKKK